MHTVTSVSPTERPPLSISHNVSQFHQVQQNAFFFIALIATKWCFEKSNILKRKKKRSLIQDNILTVQKSSTFHCLDPNCVRRCNKSSGFYLFTNRLWLYCCTVYFPFWWGGGYSSELPVAFAWMRSTAGVCMRQCCECNPNSVLFFYFFLFIDKYNCEDEIRSASSDSRVTTMHNLWTGTTEASECTNNTSALAKPWTLIFLFCF